MEKNMKKSERVINYDSPSALKRK